MADTTVNSANSVEQWADDEFYAYVRQNPLKALMGEDENSVIQVKEELTKEAGDKVTFSLVTRLTGTGVTDDATLEGNEEALGNYGCQVTVHQLRHGVVVGQYEKIKTKIDLLNAAKTMLRIWNSEQIRDLFLARLMATCTDGETAYDSCTVAQRNAWAVANNPNTGNQRVLYGSAKSNYSGVHATDLGQVDGTSDDLDMNIVRLLKRLAQSCDPHIRPVVESNSAGVGSERFKLLVGSIPFRDLESNSETVLSNADSRGDENRIFSGGMLRINNVDVIEVPEMDRLTSAGGCLLENVGAGATVEVEPVFMCGAQTLLLAWAQRMQIKMDEFDYQNKRGVAVAEIRGCKKAVYNSFDHGLVTGWVSAVGD